MDYIRDIPWGTTDELNVVIEITKGSSNKCEYDERRGYFKLDRVLHSAEFYPFDYGFIPQTRSDDGDPTDVIVLTTHPTFTGCVIKVRPIGYLSMTDEKGDDTKIIAVPITKIDPRQEEITSISSLSKHTKKEIEDFMENYKRLEPHKWVKSDGFHEKDEAIVKIKEAVEKYSKE
jgi:inorganic pyrophosphatase